MDNELQKAADKFLSGQDGKKLAGKRGDIERLAASPDGERVRSALNNSGFDDAVRRGDAAAVTTAVENVLKTDSGARLMASLRAMMGKG